MKNLLHGYLIEEEYKKISAVISSVDLNKKDLRTKSMREIMQESFFHGASWIGNNFIA